MNIFQRIFARPANSGGADLPYTEPRSGLVFPLEVGGLRRLGPGRPYSEGDRTGESIPYGNEHVQATLYVTTIANSEFPDGGETEFISGELKSAMAAVRELERLGRYQSVKFFSAAPERLGTDPNNLVWARGAFFAASGGRPMFSFTYITALRSRVIKLRISAPDAENKAVMEFPHAIGDLISRQRANPMRR